MAQRVALVLLMAGGIAVGIAAQANRTPAVGGVPANRDAVGYLDLQKRHPDPADGVEEFNSMALPDGRERLTQIRGFLDSFERMTGRVRARLSAADLKAIGNTSRELQTIGFHNIPLRVEAVLLKQEYLLRQAQYELAQLRLVRKEARAADVDRARTAYAAATRSFQEFWDKQLPTD